MEGREGGREGSGADSPPRSIQEHSHFVAATRRCTRLTHLLGPHHGVLPDHPLALAVAADVEVQRVVANVPCEPQLGELHALDELRGGGHEHLHVPACMSTQEGSIQCRKQKSSRRKDNG